MTLLALTLAIFFTAGAQVSYKLFFVRKKKPYLVLTVVLFSLTPLMSYFALKTWPLSTVYMATGLTYVLVLLLANFVLDEPISPRKLKAILLIVSGVIVFNF